MPTPQEMLESTLAYIEENKNQPLTLEELSEVSGLSRFALIRLFARLCAMTPMDYVRQRRLAASIPQLMCGARIIDIALDAGFEHEQSYIRAFKETFHMTPARFRRQEAPVPIIDVPKLSGFTVSHNGMLGKPVLMARPSFVISGALQRYNYADNLMDGTPLYEGIQRMKGEAFTAACKISSKNQFTHLYLVKTDTQDVETVSWQYPAGQWAKFQYIGLHPINQAGARRMRLMASLVISAWYSERGARWDGQFIEHAEKRWLSDDYCEVELLCLINDYSKK